METIQRVCNHPAQTITLLKNIMDYKAQHCLHLTCDHSTINAKMKGVEEDRAEARRRRTKGGTWEELQAAPVAIP